MTEHSATAGTLGRVPSWVPRPAIQYLAHTEFGTPIRALARQAGCHASTVLRQIRNWESRRDDILVDGALRRLGRRVVEKKSTGSFQTEVGMAPDVDKRTDNDPLNETTLMQDAFRVLRRLLEPGAVLAVAADLDKAAVVRDTPSGTSVRTAVVDREVAEALALKNWIAGGGNGRLSRYRITAVGRAEFNRLLAERENSAVGFAESQTPFDASEGAFTCGLNRRSAMAEPPLVLLSRRRDKDGAPFLSDDLICIGERFREDFELARMNPRENRNWDAYLTSQVIAGGDTACETGTEGAVARVTSALRDLGPGLGDVALCCCCYQEGLEKTEKRMGWSARSGKIVLRIALQRLKRFYEAMGEKGGMIG